MSNVTNMKGLFRGGILVDADDQDVFSCLQQIIHY